MSVPIQIKREIEFHHQMEQLTLGELYRRADCLPRAFLDGERPTALEWNLERVFRRGYHHALALVVQGMELAHQESISLTELKALEEETQNWRDKVVLRPRKDRHSYWKALPPITHAYARFRYHTINWRFPRGAL